MEHLLSGGQPLFGRASWAARIRAFDFAAAAEMVPGRPEREQALIYGVFGGTPRYLAAIDEDEAVANAITRSFLSPRGEINEQMQTLVEQERGILDPALYRAILTAVAGGNTRINSIAQNVGLEQPGAPVRKALDTLERLGLVAHEQNFGSHNTSPYRYRIADNAVRFWHRFVLPNRSRLEVGEPFEVWLSLVQPHLDQYMGKVFEDMVRQAFLRLHQRWDLAGPREWARWEGKDRNRRSIEIDLVSRLDDGKVLTGEVKWSSQPIGASIHYDLMRDLDDLAHSGLGWAREALDSGSSAGFLYVSAAGFADDIVRLTESDTRIRLKSLEDLYGVAPKAPA
jgi:AAA+ ATPase superfamily predicted ATPase